MGERKGELSMGEGGGRPELEKEQPGMGASAVGEEEGEEELLVGGEEKRRCCQPWGF